MKSQTSLGRMSSPESWKISFRPKLSVPPKSNQKTQQRWPQHWSTEIRRFFEKVFNCSATFWQEVRSPRSFCTTVEKNPFPANPVTPGSSQTSKQNSSCHAAGVILWFCDTNPNMALLGGNPNICLTFALFFIPPKKNWVACSDPWQMPTKKSTPQQPS